MRATCVTSVARGGEFRASILVLPHLETFKTRVRKDGCVHPAVRHADLVAQLVGECRDNLTAETFAATAPVSPAIATEGGA